MSVVKKAVIPAAGLGTRFLPATKTVPKEMLSIVDAPIILFVIEEAVSAGIEDIVLIQGRGKTAIEDFFDCSYELEAKLEADNKMDLLSRVNAIRDRANIISIRQKQPLGLGHAVLCAHPIVGDEPFAILLGDEIMSSAKGMPTTCQTLVSHFNQVGTSSVSMMEVPETEVSKYGIAKTGKDFGDYFEIEGLIEKPNLEEAPSHWALPGRYVLDGKIFEILKQVRAGKNEEIQLTDALNALCARQKIHGLKLKNERYDAGDKFGFLKANVEFGLRHPDVSEPFRSYIKDLAKRL